MSDSKIATMLDAERIATALHSDGWWVDDAALDLGLCAALLAELHALDAAAAFTTAGVGRTTTYRLDSSVRGDRTSWLTPTTPAQSTFLTGLEALRVALNRSLYLGLSATEAHFARYDPGTRYERHVDSFHGADNRIVSLVAYLNDDWRPTDGGDLVLYMPDAVRELVRVVPRAGTVAVFLSEEWPHEVLATRRDRTSIAAWLSRRPG
jgi:SM-20-related protein